MELDEQESDTLQADSQFEKSYLIQSSSKFEFMGFQNKIQFQNDRSTIENIENAGSQVGSISNLISDTRGHLRASGKAKGKRSILRQRYSTFAKSFHGSTSPRRQVNVDEVCQSGSKRKRVTFVNEDDRSDPEEMEASVKKHKKVSSKYMACQRLKVLALDLDHLDQLHGSRRRFHNKQKTRQTKRLAGSKSCSCSNWDRTHRNNADESNFEGLKSEAAFSADLSQENVFTSLKFPIDPKWKAKDAFVAKWLQRQRTEVNPNECNVDSQCDFVNDKEQLLNDNASKTKLFNPASSTSLCKTFNSLSLWRSQ